MCIRSKAIDESCKSLAAFCGTVEPKSFSSSSLSDRSPRDQIFTVKCHIFNAKSAHLYIQQIEELKERMDSTEYKKFGGGCFTIRRKDSVWSGVAPDIIIEQCLVRTMKKVLYPQNNMLNSGLPDNLEMILIC
ncbi:hypothetical protein AVEN_179492-1 [Araneus ventricosus]|uniref:Uncharacterized protein n=1 Tax=Araneus ventricosus TaxID=182803 RepID=A0A4Y2BGA5_ARAVE|nr:hypothetical protein AVEN_179492-1 [Araneus ventricosus]